MAKKLDAGIRMEQIERMDTLHSLWWRKVCVFHTFLVFISFGVPNIRLHTAKKLDECYENLMQRTCWVSLRTHLLWCTRTREPAYYDM